MTCHSIQSLADVVGGRLRMADLPPLGGPWEPVGRVVVDADAAGEGDVLLVLPEQLEADPFCLEQAYSRGVLGVVAAGRSAAPWAGRFSIEVEDAQWALWQLALHARQQFDGRVIAVTGCVGKSTAAAMIDAVLSPERTGGWNELRGGNDELLQAMLSLDEDADYAVYELHAHQRGSLDTAAHLCRPHVAVVLGCDPTSTGDFANRNAFAGCYDELLSALPDDGCAVLDETRHTPALAERSSLARGVPTMTFGRGGGSDVTASHVLCRNGSLSFAVDGQVARLPVWGRHYLAPALAAWCVGRLSGVGDAEIARRLAAFRPLAGRCVASRWGEVTLFDDTASCSAASIAASLEVLRTCGAARRRVAVCGADALADPSLCRCWGKQVVVVGGADLLVAAGSARQSIVVGAQAAGMPAAACVECESGDELSLHLAPLLAGGDAVLFKGVSSSVLDQLKDSLARRRPAAA